MARNGDISVDAMNAALTEKLTYYAPINTFLAPHFVDYVQDELRQLGFQPGLQQLNVRTTLNWNLQSAGESIVRSNLAANLYRDRGGLLSSAMVAEDPRTGDILVMVGSPDYNAKAGQIRLPVGRFDQLNHRLNEGVRFE